MDDTLAVNSKVKPSILQRFKAFWWLRGAFSALAIVGLIDLVGWDRQRWLHVVHALGARWNDWMSAFSSWLDDRIPWDVNLSAWEANALALAFALLVPASVARVSYETRAGIHWALAAAKNTGFDALMIVGALLPSSFGQRSLIFTIGLLGSIYQALFLAQKYDWFPKRIGWVAVMLPGIPSMALMFGIGPPAIASQLMIAGGVVGIVIVMWFLSRAYVKGLVFVLSMVAVLELVYLAPFAQTFMEPLIRELSPPSVGDVSAPSPP